MRTLLLTTILMALTLFGASQSIPLRIPDTTATQGAFIDIPVYADSTLTGKNILAYSIQVIYDPYYLQLVTVHTTGTILQQFGSPVVNTATSGLVKMAGAGTIPLTGSGVLIYIRFNLLVDGYSQIGFNGPLHNYFNEGNPPITLTSGQITIYPAPYITVYPDQAVLIPGDTLPFYVTGGTPPYQWSVTNPSVATVDTAGNLAAIATGVTRVIAQDSTGIKDTTNGIIEIRPFGLTIPDTLSQYLGNTIDIPIHATSVSGLNILSGSLKLQFNSGLITPVAVLTTGTLLSSYSAPVINTSIPGNLHIAFAGTTALAGSGVLCIVRFQVSSINTGTTLLTFTEAIFNQQIAAKTTPGLMDALPLPLLQIVTQSNSMVVGYLQQLAVTGNISPPLQWSVSNPAIASISQNGLLTAIGSGIVYVTVIDSLGATAISDSITIYDTHITLSDTSVCAIPQVYLYPVFIESLPYGKTVHSYEGRFSVLSNSARITGVSNNSTLTQGWMIAQNISGNEILVASSGTNGFNTAGIMLFLEIEIDSTFNAGENIPVTINNIILNEGSPTALTYPFNNYIYGLNTDTLKVEVTANPPGGICEGVPVTYTALVSNGGIITSYVWKVNGIQQGGNSPMFSPASLQNNDLIECIVTSQSSLCLTGNPATSAPVTAIIFPNPVISPIPDDTVCANSTATINVSVTGGTSPLSYLWSNNATSNPISPVITQNAQFWVQVTDINNCAASDTLLVLVSYPQVTLGSSDTVCKGNIVPLTGQVTGGFSPITYSWSTGASTLSINLTALTDTCANLTITDKVGCTSKDTVCILVSHITANAGPDQGACAVTTVTFNGTASNGFPPYSYTWNNNPGQSYQTIATANANLVFNATDIIGCTATDTAMLTAYPNPVISPMPDDTVCANSTATLNVSVTGGTSPLSYLWSNNATTNPISPVITQNAQFWVQVTDINNCQTSDTVMVFASNPQVNLGPDLSECFGIQVQLGGQITGGFGPFSHLWSTGDVTTQINHLASADTCINLVITDIIGCESTDTVCIAVNPLPTPNLGPDDTICISHTMILDPGPGFASYHWSTGASTPNLLIDGSVLGTGTFTFSVSVTNQFGCSNADTVAITVDPCIGTGSISYDKHLIIHPNPASEYFDITNGFNGEYTVTILSSSGIALLRKTISNHNAGNERIMTVSLPSGVYLVHIETAEGLIVRKLVKQ